MQFIEKFYYFFTLKPRALFQFLFCLLDPNVNKDPARKFQLIQFLATLALNMLGLGCPLQNVLENH